MSDSASFDVVVIGLGAMGSAAASHLARRGQRVLGFDRHRPPHALGSSHGQSRIIREAYFEDPRYVPLVQRAYALWSQLSKETRTDLFLETGGLMLGPPGGSLVSGSALSAATHHLRHERLNASEIHRRFPAFHPPAHMEGIWEPRAGVLYPEKCIDAHLRVATAHKATLHYNEVVTHWKPCAGGVRIVTSARQTFTAAQLVITAGSWATTLVPDLHLPLTVERQPMFWFAPHAPDDFAPGRCPIYICQYESEKYFYGFPAVDGSVKVAHHHRSTLTTPDKVNRDVSAAECREMHHDVKSILPGLSDRLVHASVCISTNTPDGHFVLDRHPEYPQVLVASPCSGHGFKFSAAIGEIIADLVLDGTSRFDLSLFALARPALRCHSANN